MPDLAQVRRRLLTGLLPALLVVAVDQASKWWIVGHVMDPPRFVELTSFFNLVMVWNKGISFGLFGSGSSLAAIALPVLAAAVSVVLGLWMVRTPRRYLQVILGLVIGGAVGNLIDRFRYGAVADFLDFHIAGFHWPAFNVADSAITVGAVLLVADSLFNNADKPNNRESQGSDRS